MRIEVGSPRPDEMAEFYHERLNAYMLKVDGLGIAVGGFATDAGGRVWAWLDTRPDRMAGHGRSVIRAIREQLRSAGETVYVQCQSAEFATAERLLRVLGFERTDGILENREVWVWRN